MVKQYQLNPRVRFVNRIMSQMIRWNIAPANSYLLSVRGRKTGNLYSTPVTIVQHNGQRWLVAPYGEVNWVRNARAAGQVTLSRGGKSESLALQELPPQERAPILKQYLPLEPIVQPYFNAKPGSPLEDFAAEAGRHPVFRLGLRHSPHPGCPPVDSGFPDGAVSNDDG
jgi:deazaflavin-dependent oxidoreductase (nitroreductase family)